MTYWAGYISLLLGFFCIAHWWFPQAAFFWSVSAACIIVEKSLDSKTSQE